MSMMKMIALALAFSFGGAAIGGLIGYGLGIYAPDFYRATVDSRADPVQVGLGFGIAQGLVMGFVLACVIVIARSLQSRNRRD